MCAFLQDLRLDFLWPRMYHRLFVAERSSPRGAKFLLGFGIDSESAIQAFHIVADYVRAHRQPGAARWQLADELDISEERRVAKAGECVHLVHVTRTFSGAKVL